MTSTQSQSSTKYYKSKRESDSGLVKLVVVNNIFFNEQQHEIKTKRFICVKQIRSSFFSNNGNKNFCS